MFSKILLGFYPFSQCFLKIRTKSISHLGLRAEECYENFKEILQNRLHDISKWWFKRSKFGTPGDGWVVKHLLRKHEEETLNSQHSGEYQIGWCLFVAPTLSRKVQQEDTWCSMAS